MKFALEDGELKLQKELPRQLLPLSVGGNEGLDQVVNKLEVIGIWKSKPLVIG